MTFRVFVTADVLGDSWPYSLDLARGLARLGIDTVLAVLGPLPSERQRTAASQIARLELIETGLALPRLAGDAAALRAIGEKVARLAEHHGADLVHLNNPALAADVDFELPLVAVQQGCAATWWEAVHGTPLPAESAWRAAVVEAGLCAADIVVAPTASFAEATRRTYRLAERPHVVHHGRAPVAPPRHIPRDFVLTAGRLWDEGENVDLLDSAAQRIAVPVRAAGPLEGPDGSSVMFDHIHCLGALDEAEREQLLSARPVFVSAALYEPFGPAVLEAAAAGCALILSDIPSFRELWDEVALFVPPRDEEAFTCAIAGLVADDLERAVMGRAARERAGLYTYDAMAAQMAALYRSLLPAVRRPVLAALAA